VDLKSEGGARPCLPLKITPIQGVEERTKRDVKLGKGHCSGGFFGQQKKKKKAQDEPWAGTAFEPEFRKKRTR